MCVLLCGVFFFQAEDGIRDLVRSRGLGDVYKRQGVPQCDHKTGGCGGKTHPDPDTCPSHGAKQLRGTCLLYTSDAADERSSVDLGGRRIIKKKKHSRLGERVERQ